MGYMDFITDTRNTAYNRRYVGQTVDAKRRIAREHFQGLLNHSTQSLHHFCVWIGNGTREANFIRLWSCPSEDDILECEGATETWNEVQQSLLEALFCKAFQTHHGVLDRHEPNKLQKISSYGLNVLSPLWPSRKRPTFQQVKFVHEIDSTPDPQILYWKKVLRPRRKAQEQEKEKQQCEASLGMRNFDYHGAFKESLSQIPSDHNLFEAFKASFAQPRPDPKPLTQDIQYFGNRSAQFAFVLDFAVTAPEFDGLAEEIDSEKKISSTIDLPWALQGCQFNATNVLVWTFNFKAFSSLNKEHVHYPASDQSFLYAKFKMHRELLDHSNAKVIFICGAYAARALHFAFKSKQLLLELRGFKYPLYIEISTSAQITHRLFILCPSIPARIWSNGRGNSAKLSEAIRFGIKLLNIRGLRPY